MRTKTLEQNTAQDKVLYLKLLSGVETLMLDALRLAYLSS